MFTKRLFYPLNKILTGLYTKKDGGETVYFSPENGFPPPVHQKKPGSQPAVLLSRSLTNASGGIL
jgi:hypothetical protein